MDNEAQILKAIKWRQYDRLDKLLENELEEWGWSCLRKTLITKTGKLKSARLRDGLLHMMGLSTVRGIDIVPMSYVKNKLIDGDSLIEIRTKSSEIAYNVLKEMIEVKNTILLDPQAMKNGPFVTFVPDILEAREQEVMDLPPKPTIWDVVQTAYGFQVFTTGGVLTSKNSLDFQRLSKALIEVSGALGKDLEFSPSPLRLGAEISGFENCSEATRELLWHVLRLNTYKGKQMVRKSAKFIELNADSRITNFLHDFLSRTKYYYTAVKIIRALGNIGLPESMDYLLPFLDKGRSWTSSTMKAISSLTGDRITERLIGNFINSSTTSPSARTNYYLLTRALWDRPPDEVLEHIGPLKTNATGWEQRRVQYLEQRAQRALAKQMGT